MSPIVVGHERSDEQELEEFFDVLGDTIAPTLKLVCSVMWRAYLDVIRRRAGDAIYVLDQYHIMPRMNKAIDDVRASEARRMKQDGQTPILKHSREVLSKVVFCEGK